MKNKIKSSVLVIDFGSQYSQLITKKIRNLGIYSEIISSENKEIIEKLREFNALILSGSPDSVEEQKESLISEILKSGKPILGICYGMQLIHKFLGGTINKSERSEFGETDIEILSNHLLIKNIPSKFKVWMSHNDSVIKLANEFKLLGKSKNCSAITINDNKKIYTVQFHPEVKNTEYGEEIFKNFLFEICKFSSNWKPKEVILEKIEQIKSVVKNDKVLLALSGGIDSSVTAELLNLASPKNIICLFIDTGLLQKNIKEKIVSYFSQKFKSNFHVLECEEEFLFALKGIEEPEEKRKIIGKVFSDIFSRFSQQYPEIKYLAQGTIYPDLIESGKKSKKSKTIKTHHNTIEELKNKFKLIEPLSDLFKDEVKKIGKELNIASWILEQHPFPGPGLAIRISGEVTKEKISLLKDIDYIFTEKLKKNNLYNKIKQAFAILLSTKSVGIKGDKRTYGYTVVLRAINTEDFMTSNIFNFSWDFLKEISSEITGKIPEISRVLYDITSKPPATIEWE